MGGINMEMYLNIAVKMIVGSLGVFILIRLMGKKAMSELTPFDLLYVIILGALVEEALYDDKVNVFHILFAIILWGLLVYLLEKAIQRTESLSSLIEGEPSVLIEEGHLNMQELRENFFDMEQLRAMLRQEGVYSIDEVHYAILEVNGHLTVITKEEGVSPTFLLIEEGTIQQATLNYIDKDEKWLLKELEIMGHFKMKDIVYCEWQPDSKKLLVGTYNDTISRDIYIDD